MYDLRQLTNAQLVRLHYNVWERMTRYDGYQPFAYDRRTLQLTSPGWLACIDAIELEYTRR